MHLHWKMHFGTEAIGVNSGTLLYYMLYDLVLHNVINEIIPIINITYTLYNIQVLCEEAIY